MNKYELVLAKARNLCYYFSIDTRPRSTYIHIVRKIRSEMKALLSDFEVGSPEYEKLLGIVRSCPQKIKTEECEDFIMNTLRPVFL